MRRRQELTRTVLHVLPHAGGGAETYVAALERALGDDWRHERVELSAGRSPASALRSLPARYPGLARAARQVDLVHVHGDMATVLAAPALRGRRVFVTTHGLHFLRRSRGALFSRALRRALARAEVVACTSAAERDELLARGVDARLVVVHNAVAEPRLSDRAAARASFGLDDDVVAVAFVGELEERKQPRVAVRAVQAAGASLRLLVAGEGPQSTLLVGERVHLLGRVEDVAPLLAAADVFVAPAEREGLSYALLEAMAAGLAIVASDAPGNAEALGDAGVVVPVGDEAVLARELASLAADPERRARLGAAARARAREEFSEERFATAMRELYGA